MPDSTKKPIKWPSPLYLLDHFKWRDSAEPSLAPFSGSSPLLVKVLKSHPCHCSSFCDSFLCRQLACTFAIAHIPLQRWHAFLCNAPRQLNHVNWKIIYQVCVQSLLSLKVQNSGNSFFAVWKCVLFAADRHARCTCKIGYDTCIIKNDSGQCTKALLISAYQFRSATLIDIMLLGKDIAKRKHNSCITLWCENMSKNVLTLIRLPQ